jgi:hypothetical protein
MHTENRVFECVTVSNIRGRSIPRFGMESIPGEINLGIAWN